MHKQFSLKKQQGITLLILAVIMVLVFLAFTVSQLSINDLKVQQSNKTQIELKKAKKALLNFAVARADIFSTGATRKGYYGFLPCPDYNGINGEGNQGLNCEATNESAVGLLPYRALDLDVINDGNGDCLFYAVSGTYKQSPQTGMLNEDSNGFFQLVDNNGVPVAGIEPEDRIVAIVISPGKVLSGQMRNFTANSECGQDYSNLTAYLDSNGITDNAVENVGVDTLVQYLPKNTLSELETNPYNDKMMTISREEIWSAVMARPDFSSKIEELTEALALCLVEYANSAPLANRLPWPARVALADYRMDSNYRDEAGLYLGRYPLDVSLSNVSTGHVLDGNKIFNVPGCQALTLSNGKVVNLSGDFSEYHHLWQNWKDHIFYALSKKLEPTSSDVDCSSDCIEVSGATVTPVAVVFYSGSRFDGRTRNSIPLDPIDEKADILNYLENADESVLTDAKGESVDIYNINPSNDVMFCIHKVGVGSELGVSLC